MTQHETQYKDWILNLVRTCIPLELRIKILTMQPLSKEEIRKYVHVVALASQAKALMQNDSLASPLEKNTERIIRTIKSEREKGLRENSPDPRTPQQRDMIDSAVVLYVRRKHIENKSVSLRQCAFGIWLANKETAPFDDFQQFCNATRYDFNNYYPLDLLMLRAKDEVN